MTAAEWIRERLDNCQRIAATKAGTERDGWLEDADYFAATLEALAVPKVPVAWGLWNPATRKLDHRCYQREEAAKLGAANQTNRWQTWVAVPLFLQPPF